MGLHVFVWPQGTFVQIYGLPHWQRRLAGETRDAHPDRVVAVAGFSTYAEFCAWCRNTNPWW
ncbi:hypothetical protein GCM10027174_32810 [Salinifilum aidingensis]